MPPRVAKTGVEAKFRAQIAEIEKELEEVKIEYNSVLVQKEELGKQLSSAEKLAQKLASEVEQLKKAKSDFEQRLKANESQLEQTRKMEVALRQQVDALLDLQKDGMISPAHSKPAPAVQTAAGINRGGVTPQAKSFPVGPGPDSSSKVKNMLSTWENKGKALTAPDLSKLPSINEEPGANLKRKPEKMESLLSVTITELPPLETSFDLGPILEIPEELLAELNSLHPVEREQRISVLKIEAEERRKSIQGVQNSTAPPPVETPTFFTGRIAAALKLFNGGGVPKQPLGPAPWSASKLKLPEQPKKNIPPQAIPEEDENIDGAEIEGPLFPDAAAQVAQAEAKIDALEKKVWLADIEEIKIASTPAKKGGSDKSVGFTINPEWSVVSQKMNLACQLTPVVPGRRSCIVVAGIPKMVVLGPKLPDDQYDVTDKDTDSEEELSPTSRAKKHIPAWCSNWRQKAIAQIAVDPESIFGASLPKCDLDVVFTEDNYKLMGLQRPKRTRGSSGNWAFDKLTQDEVDKYRAKCGQVVKAEGVFVDTIPGEL